MIQSQGQSLTPLVKEKEEMAMKHDKLHGLQEPYQVLKPDGELRHRIGGGS